MTQIESNDHHTHITSKHCWYDLKLKEVWQYKDLIVLFTKRSFQVTYKQTILGPAWIFLNPFITSVIYTLVFGEIAGIATDGVPKILFYMSGTAIWSFFSSCVTRNARTFTSNAHVFGKVYFPRLTVPLSNVLSSIIQFCIQMIMLGFFFVYFLIQGQVEPHWELWPFIPLILIVLGVIGMGVGIIVSSLTTKYRDLSILVNFGVQLWMYGTPIVYPLSTLSEGMMKSVIMINPVTLPVELFRYILLGQGTINVNFLIWPVIFAIIVAVFGIMIFNKVERTFMDTV